MCEYRTLKDAPVNRKLGSFPGRSCQNGVGEKKKGCKEVRSSMCWFAPSRSDHCRSPTDHLYHGPLIDFGPDGRPGHICNWRSMWSSYIFIKREDHVSWTLNCIANQSVSIHPIFIVSHFSWLSRPACPQWVLQRQERQEPRQVWPAQGRGRKILPVRK